MNSYKIRSNRRKSVICPVEPVLICVECWISQFAVPVINRGIVGARNVRSRHSFATDNWDQGIRHESGSHFKININAINHHFMDDEGYCKEFLKSQ